jgi:hypothetical protein
MKKLTKALKEKRVKKVIKVYWMINIIILIFHPKKATKSMKEKRVMKICKMMKRIKRN